MYFVRKGLEQKGTQLRKALAFFREMRYNTINRTHVLFCAVYKEKIPGFGVPGLARSKKETGQNSREAKKNRQRAGRYMTEWGENDDGKIQYGRGRRESEVRRGRT